MKIQYVRFREAVQSPGKGGNTSSTFRSGEKYNPATTSPFTLLAEIVRDRDTIILVDRAGSRRRMPFTNVVDFEIEDDELTDKDRKDLEKK